LDVAQALPPAASALVPARRSKRSGQRRDAAMGPRVHVDMPCPTAPVKAGFAGWTGNNQPLRKALANHPAAPGEPDSIQVHRCNASRASRAVWERIGASLEI